MGRIKVETIDDLVSKGFDLVVRCRRCRREVVIDRHRLRLWQHVLRWWSYCENAALHFPCRDCGPGTIEWGVVLRDHGRPLLDLDQVARARRDALLTKARFWHDLSRGRDPRRRRARLRDDKK